MPLRYRPVKSKKTKPKGYQRSIPAGDFKKRTDEIKDRPDVKKLRKRVKKMPAETMQRAVDASEVKKMILRANAAPKKALAKTSDDNSKMRLRQKKKKKKKKKKTQKNYLAGKLAQSARN